MRYSRRKIAVFLLISIIALPLAFFLLPPSPPVAASPQNPGKPVLYSPVDGTVTNDNTPTFEWTVGPDADNHRLLVDASPPDWAGCAIDTTILMPDNTYTPTTGLADDNYSWKVIAVNLENENESDTWTILIDTVASAPTLLLPADGAITSDNTPAFDWSDVGDAENYDLLVDNDSGFPSPEIQETVFVSTYTPTTELADENYFWKVKVRDLVGNENESDVWSFVIDTTESSYTYVAIYDNVKGTVENFDNQKQEGEGYSTINEEARWGGEIVSNISVAQLVDNAGSPDARDTAWNTWLTNRDFVGSVTYLTASSVTQAQLETYDVVFMCRSVDEEANVATAVKPANVGVMFVNRKAYDTMKFGTGDNYVSSQTQVTIVDNTHYITLHFPEGNVTYTSSDYESYISGWSGDIECFGQIPGQPTQASILVLEKGENHIDNSIAPERRVFSGLGYYGPANMNENGDNLDERALRWVLRAFSLDIYENIENVQSGDNYYLEMLYKLNNTKDNFRVQIWNGSTWENRGDVLNSTSWTFWSYQLLDSELTGDGDDVQVRFIDVDNESPCPNAILKDYVRVRSTPLPPGKPVLYSPVDGTITNDNTPFFEWTAGWNADNHRLLIDNNSDFSTPNENRIIIADNNYTIADENSLPSDNYFWKVVAINAQGENESTTWTFVIDTVAPSAPTPYLPADGAFTNDNTVYFEWSSVADAENYDLFVDNDSDFSSPEVSVTITDNYCTSSTLPDENYSWRVRTRDAVNNVSDNSATWTFLIDTLAPAAPTITAPADGENTNDNTPTITWNAVSENSSPVLYRVWIDNNSDFFSPENDSGWITTTSFTPAELNDNLYYLRVCAKDNAGNQGDNSQRTFRVDTLAPASLTLVSPDNGAQITDSTPTLSWNAVNDNSLPVTYDLQVDDVSDFSSPTENVSGLTDNSYTTSSLADGTWYWRVRARDNAGNAGNWSSRLFTVDTTAQAAPALTAPVNGAFANDSTPTFDWESVSGAASYILQYSADSGFTQNFTTISSTATDYTPIEALSDGTWYWRVRAIDAVGNTGGWSSIWSFTIDTITPTVTISPALGATPTATGWTLTTTNSSIEISGSVRDATGVTVKINDKVVPVVGGSFSKTITLMVLGTNTFTIAVTDAAGNSTTRTLSVTRAGAPTVAAPAISPELAVFLGALVAIVIILMVLVKMALVKKY